MTLPKPGFVYTTTLAEATVLLCVRTRDLILDNGRVFEFLVLEGGPPGIRMWSSGSFTMFTMEDTMRKYNFERIA